MRRVSEDDLRLAADWCDSFEATHAEGDPKASDAKAKQRVAGWLRTQAARRAENRAITTFVRGTGISRAEVRRNLENTLGETAKTGLERHRPAHDDRQHQGLDRDR